MVLEIRRSEARKKVVGVADLLEKLAVPELIARVDPIPADVVLDAVKGRMAMALAVPAQVAQELGQADFVADRVVQVQADALADGLRVGARKEVVPVLRKVLVEVGHLG